MSAPIWQRSSERYSARFSARPIGADKDIDRRPQTGDHRQETGEVYGHRRLWCLDSTKSQSFRPKCAAPDRLMIGKSR